MQDQGDAGLLTLQTSVQFGDETGRQLIGIGIGTRQICQFDHQRAGVLVSDARDPLRPLLGRCPFALGAFDAHGYSAQIFDQGQAQHDRHRPQFAQRQGRMHLVGGDETVEAVAVDASIGMRDQFQGQGVHPRQADGIADHQQWQLPAVTARQMAPHQGDLFAHLVMVIKQPLARRHRRPAGGGGIAQLGEGLLQHLRILAQPGQQRAAATPTLDLMPTCQIDGVPFEPFTRKNLGPQ